MFDLGLRSTVDTEYNVWAVVVAGGSRARELVINNPCVDQLNGDFLDIQ
jgi:hypothetical protein